MSSIRYKKTSKRATKRKNVKVDTRDIRDGEVRVGPKGERNVFDKKTGRWYRATRRPPTSISKKTTSGTVTSAKPKKRAKNLGLGEGGKPTRTKESVLAAANKRNQARKDAMSKEGRKKAKDKYTPSYQTGSKGGKTYDRAMRKAKGKVDTAGERGMDSLGRKLKSITDPASRRGRDAIVRANNEKVRVRNEQRRKEKQDALKTAAKKLAEKKRKYR